MNTVNHSKSTFLPIVVLFIFCGAALVIGMGGALFGVFGQVFLLTALVPLALLAMSYRFGLFALILLMPFAGAQFIPKIGPLSVVNLLLVGILGLVLLRLALRKIMGKEVDVQLPRAYLLYYVLPITLGFVMGSGHLQEIPVHMLEEDGKGASLSFYWISTYFKTMLWSLCAVVLGTVIAEHRNARALVHAAIASAVIFVLVTLLLFVFSPQTLETAVNSRQMFSATGRHANGVGAMLLPVIGVALFMRESTVSMIGRLSYALITIILVGGVFLTGSRGALLGLFVVLGAYVWQLKKIRAVFVVIFLAGGAILAAPPEITDRLTMGISNVVSGQQEVTSSDERLTSGRLHLATLLFPEFLQSPLIGHGINSTRWSDYAKSGGPISHPHNLYLATLMDIGIVGFICMGMFVLYVYKLLKRLSSDERLDNYMRGYFKGSVAGLMGFMTFGLSGGYPYPQIEQWFVWVSLGIALGVARLLTLDHPEYATRDNQAALTPAIASGYWRGGR